MMLVARQEIEPIEATLVSARLNIGGLSEGRYSVHIVLKKREGETLVRVAEAREMIRKIPGPFSSRQAMDKGQ